MIKNILFLVTLWGISVACFTTSAHASELPKTGPKKGIVSVNNEEVSLDWIQAYRKKHVFTPEAREKYGVTEPCHRYTDEYILEILIQSALITQAAKKKDFTPPEPSEYLKQVYKFLKQADTKDPQQTAIANVDRLLLEEIDYKQALKPEISRQEVEREYKTLKENKDPNIINVVLVKVYYATMNSEQEAREVLDRIAKGEHFDSVVSKIDPMHQTQKRYGLGQWRHVSEHGEKFQPALTTAAISDVVGPSKTVFGWSLGYLADKKIIDEVTLESEFFSPYEYIHDKLLERKTRELYKDLRLQANVALNGKPLPMHEVLYEGCE